VLSAEENMYFCTFDIEMKISDMMKVYTFLVLAVFAILTSCQMHEDLEPVLNHDVLYAAIDDFEQTRTMMDKSNLFWTEGDQIVAFMKSSKGLKYQISASSAGSNSAVFENVSGMNPSPGTRIVHNIAYYPYGSKVAVSKLGDNYIVDAVLPADQIYAPNSFGKDSFPMVAVSDSDHFLFKNVCGAIKLQVTGNHKVASVRIEGKNNEKLSGSAVVAIFPDGSVPSITMTSGSNKYVVLNCGTQGVQLSQDSVTDFIISLPPVNFSKGFTVSITDVDGKVRQYETDEPNTILRSGVLVMPVIKCESSSINGTLINAENDLVGLVSDAETGDGIPGVAVSDGYSVVRTDANGVYQFVGNSKARTVFISVPAEYEVPLDDNKSPAFYKSGLVPGQTNRNDFKLYPLAESEENFTLVAIGDPQVKKSSHVTRYKNETISDIKQTLSENQSIGKYKNAYAVTLGDVVHDKPDLWASVMQTMKNVRLESGKYLPIFQCAGNHDHNAAKSTDYDALEDFVSHCGPENYSFNRGKVHIVVMDDIVCTNINSSGGKWDYKAGFSDAQYAWLEQDLAAVENKDDKMIIICLHIPLKSEVDFKPHYKEILALMCEFNEAHFMIGHTHYFQNYIHEDYKSRNGLPIYEHIHGAACGGWWTCNLNVDGAPNGYSLYEIEGDHMKNWVAKSTGLPADYQMRVYNGNQTYTGVEGYIYNWYKDSVGEKITYKGREFLKDCFVLNLWNDDASNWSVEFTYNGKTTPMERVSSTVMDAAVVSYFFNEKNKSTTSYTKAMEHFWYVQSPDGLDPSEVRGWTITATQVIPGSGERNVYTANSLQTDYVGF
jgi:DNA repair exonuclease SbcCD nuclease subunit